MQVMDVGSFAIIVANFVYIGLLPVVFFKRDGSLNAMWWLTAAPFLISVGSIIAAFVSGNPVLLMGNSPIWLQGVAALLSTASIALISFTLGTHKIPIALWHQKNDAPVQIVTWGAYKTIRHPFYSSFLLAFVAALLYYPYPTTLLGLIWGVIILNSTAAREEERLKVSEFGKDYQEYMLHTGRFVPKIGSAAK